MRLPQEVLPEAEGKACYLASKEVKKRVIFFCWAFTHFKDLPFCLSSPFSVDTSIFVCYSMFYEMADVNFSDQNFEAEVLKSAEPVVVDFWAEWCTPCRIVSPIIEELAEEYKGKVKVGKLNVDENPSVSGQFNVMSIPSILIFKDGMPVKTIIGAQAKDNFKRAIDEVLSS
ncbi:MAG: lpbca thioredoxin [Candidatus Levybacteria bacterium GW2011_GWC1_40_19]|nr:MAG: lpbca thioredoxin [Candidatus Levybacteria bacterium GW2011_GWC1_40_19]KKR72349.1 MAG: lpbca thioredoxin [Candidatus Levybacteria bacterium GW2011_GWC2_40_7]